MPRSINRALANDFSTRPKQRELQLEAVALIHVQKLIDEGNDPDVWPASETYARPSISTTTASPACGSPGERRFIKIP